MTRESRGLGRGLESLLGANPTVSASRGGGTLPISLMQAGSFQPRREIHAEPLAELAASIKANGVIEPIIVRALPAGAVGPARYEIIAGERRWRAAKLAGLSNIPVIVRELSDQQAVAIALIENIQREELTPVEEARAIERLIEEFSLTHSEVADSVGRSRAAVSNLLRLLDLPDSVVALIDAKKISMGHARALLGLNDDAERVRLAQFVADRGLSVREIENLVRRALTGEGSAAPPKPPDLSVMSEIVRSSSVHAVLHQKVNGSARIVVNVSDANTRDRIVEALKRGAE